MTTKEILERFSAKLGTIGEPPMIADLIDVLGSSGTDPREVGTVLAQIRNAAGPKGIDWEPKLPKPSLPNLGPKLGPVIKVTEGQQHIRHEDYRMLREDIVDLSGQGFNCTVGVFHHADDVAAELGLAETAAHDQELYVELIDSPEGNNFPLIEKDTLDAGGFAPTEMIVRQVQVQALLASCNDKDRAEIKRRIRSVYEGRAEKVVWDLADNGARVIFRLSGNSKPIRLTRLQIADREIAELAGKFSPLKLQRVSESAVHKVQAACHARDVLCPAAGKDRLAGDLSDMFDQAPQVFLIQHDWAGAFSKATDFEGGEWRIPYPVCLFELRVNGARLVCRAEEHPDHGVWIVPFVETSVGWSVVAFYDQATGFTAKQVGEHPAVQAFQPIVEFVTRQIRAISIALEAEVATTDIVRAPHKLNHAREKAGKLPIFDHHVVTLSRRARPAALEEHEPTGRHNRLHFVRGHWRHYENHKTWIKWHLRGDPDLGFIDKTYRL